MNNNNDVVVPHHGPDEDSSTAYAYRLLHSGDRSHCCIFLQNLSGGTKLNVICRDDPTKQAGLRRAQVMKEISIRTLLYFHQTFRLFQSSLLPRRSVNISPF